MAVQNIQEFKIPKISVDEQSSKSKHLIKRIKSIFIEVHTCNLSCNLNLKFTFKQHQDYDREIDDSNEDNFVSEEISNVRIVLILIFTGSFLSCLATVFLYFEFSNYLNGQSDIKIIQFEEKKTEENPMKRLHIAIHANDNELFDFHLQENLRFSWSMQVPQQSSQIIYQEYTGNPRYRTPRYRTPRYRTPRYRTPRYRTPKF